MKMKVFGMLSLMTMLAAGTAMAQPWGHGGTGGPGGGLLNQLIYPCQSACFRQQRPCVQTAASVALTAINGTCSSEIAAAQKACQTGPLSKACRKDDSALKTCAQSDLQTFQSAVESCRSTILQPCLDACEQ